MVWKIYTLTFEKWDNRWHIGIANYVNGKPVKSFFGKIEEQKFIEILKPHLKEEKLNCGYIEK